MVEQKKTSAKPQPPVIKDTIIYKSLKSELVSVHQIQSKQERGYAFEKLITNIFTIFKLNPRASYRVEHDQIDGSFTLDGYTVLVEAKYKESLIPKK